MWRNGIPVYELKTGVTEIDGKIEYLIEIVGGNISGFLSKGGNISCNKINEKKENILEGMDESIVELVERNLNEVRVFLSETGKIGDKLNRCGNIAGCKEIISKYPKNKISNNTILSILLSKCGLSEQCEEVLKEYGKGVSLNINVLKILIRKCGNLGKCLELLKMYGNNIELDIEAINILLKKCNSSSDIRKVLSKYLGENVLNNESCLLIFEVLVNDGNKLSSDIFDNFTKLLTILNSLKLDKNEFSRLNRLNNKKGAFYTVIRRIIRDNNLENLRFMYAR